MEEQFGYQTEQVESQVQDTNTQQEPAQEIPATTQDDFIEVKYNKENMRISRDEAPAYIQKGLNYDKVSQRATEYEKHLDRVAKLAGYQSHEDMLRQLDQIEKQQQEQEYRQAGLDPNVLNKYLEQHPDIQYARELKAKQEADEKFRNEANELFSEFPDLKANEIPKEVWVLKEQKGLSLLDAYLRVSYKNLGQQKEQEALQKLQSNAQASTGSLGGGDVQHNTSVKDMPKADFEALLRKVKNGEVQSL
ncbi:hypothetical protein SAMN05877753_111157 [Bacillus oleivorans]|uniref:Uncharacterized protein n=1 Tax=Bacillus oleivorans TaxID=1448271 RepID=A0A285D687_9BACI|nr:hypothetical protein [Bacillus oleivorans]SNX75322.1 hypothetical protein SAMN05877753_111157 [Bacillus oleivorans]